MVPVKQEGTGVGVVVDTNKTIVVTKTPRRGSTWLLRAERSDETTAFPNLRCAKLSLFTNKADNDPIPTGFLSMDKQQSDTDNKNI